MERTTDAVVARPTPSAPCFALSPLKHPTILMMAPNTTPLIIPPTTSNVTQSCLIEFRYVMEPISA